MAGVSESMQDIRELVEPMFLHPELFQHLGITPPRGILLHGPPGCGKTLLAHAIAGELGVPFIKVAGPELIGGTSGESEKSIRDLFSQGVLEAQASGRGCIIFLDEIDVVTPKRETAQREMERRIVAQLLTSMDDLARQLPPGSPPVLVLGATNRPDSIDPAVRRAGRFDREFGLNVPSMAAREEILRVLCEPMRLADDTDFQRLARHTPGFVGADLKALVSEAGLNAISRAFHALAEPAALAPSAATSVAADEAVNAMDVDTQGEEQGDEGEMAARTDAALESGQAVADETAAVARPLACIKKDTALSVTSRGEASDRLRLLEKRMTPEELVHVMVTMDDFSAALKRVQPSAKREGFATTPEVTWEDVGALGQPRLELEEAITYPLQRPELCAQLGMTRPPGVLLFGPPGCGKTMLAKALANGCAANFISVKGPELLNKFVGESERAVRQVFLRARTSSPCIVFFDELDALCPRRDNTSSSRVTERLVNQLLTELDGFDRKEKEQIFVIGATNRPDMIDPAMLRPGRLDKLVYVDLPNVQARAEILSTHARRLQLAPDVILEKVAQDPRCEGFSGADLAALLREAGTAALRRLLAQTQEDISEVQIAPAVTMQDVEVAYSKVPPSVSRRDLERYRRMARDLRRPHVVPHERAESVSGPNPGDPTGEPVM